ncbi:ABC transporter substrate binding protein [Desulfococcaceae bacterium HSG7]|nr:ABC transporter substrate binding protein [Desulfococcaceae bacterium HSG7]
MKLMLKRIIFICAVILISHISIHVYAKETAFSNSPKLNDGEKWRIGYYEGGPYINYKNSLIGTIQGLMELGWIERAEIPNPEPEKEESTPIWEWLVTKSKSKYILFLKDGHYSADWDKKVRIKMMTGLIKRLNAKKDIDFIIGMGTWAGKDLANNKHKTPTIICSTSDAVGAGIIKSPDDSGFDHIHAQVDPYRHVRQIHIFHDYIEFKRLGMLYEDTEDGRSYAALEKVKKVAKERKFKIVKCFTKSDGVKPEVATASVKKCLEKLAKQKVDAIYITEQGGVSAKTICDHVKIINDNRIPSFSQSGQAEVERGLLMSIAKPGYKYVGLFQAKTMAKAFNGAKLRQLEQVHESPPKIAINLQTAEKIEWDVPVEILGIADAIFTDIKECK